MIYYDFFKDLVERNKKEKIKHTVAKTPSKIAWVGYLTGLKKFRR
jgi:hypothetical protein